MDGILGALPGTFDRVGVAAADQRRRGDDLALAASMSAADERAFFTSIEPAGPRSGARSPGAPSPRPPGRARRSSRRRRRGGGDDSSAVRVLGQDLVDVRSRAIDRRGVQHPMMTEFGRLYPNSIGYDLAILTAPSRFCQSLMHAANRLGSRFGACPDAPGSVSAATRSANRRGGPQPLHLRELRRPEPVWAGDLNGVEDRTMTPTHRFPQAIG
jgi:hypothetical protein